MKKGTRIIMIIDQSGSMSSIKNDAIGGFNSFLESQQNIDDYAQMKIVLFNHNYNLIIDDNIKNIKTLDNDSYMTVGSTALYDAIGKTIYDELDYLASLKSEERFEKYIVVILTDGEENSSFKYGKDEIFKLISNQETEFNWEFVFLAANQDAFASAKSIGISGKAVFNFASDSKGTRSVYATMDNVVSSYRKNDSVNYNKELNQFI